MAGAIAPATAPRRDQDQPGAQSPRPAPAPPPAGASLPPGRALASAPPGATGLQGTVPRGRGNAMRFLVPPELMTARSPRQWQGPSPLPQRHADPGPAGGPKPPASARPAPGGRFSPAGSGAWPVGITGPAGLWGTIPLGRGKRGSRFLFPPALTKALPPPQWQGPSPLPQRCIGIRTSRGPQPPASARPATGGRFPPAGPGAGLSWCLGPPVCGAPLCAGGGNALRFLVPPGEAKALPPPQWQGPTPLPQRKADP